MSKNEQTKSYNPLLAWGMLFFSAFAGILYGYDIGILTGALPSISLEFGLTGFKESLLASAVFWGGLAATLFAGKLADLFGRKNMIITSAVIFFISVISIYYAGNYSMLFIGRVLQGVAAGFIVVIIPLYITETSPNHLRGRATVLFQLFITFSIVLATLISYTIIKNMPSLGFINGQEVYDWRLMFLTSGIPAVILMLGSFLLVKSPKWLAMKNRFDLARNVLCLVRKNKEDIDIELDQLKTHHIDKTSFLHYILNNKVYMKAFIIVLFLATLNTLSGINAILQLSTTLLKNMEHVQFLGLFYITPIVAAILLTAINFIATIFGIFIADKFERKYIAATGIFVFFIGLLMTAYATYIGNQSFILIGLIIFILGFAFGPGSLIWVLLTELLPTPIRSMGMSFALILNTAASAVLISVFIPFAAYWGPGPYLMCGMFGIFYFLFMLIMIPKTKGKSLEEIEESI